MFFILSKIMWFLLAPLNLVAICTASGILFLRLKKPRAAGTFFIASLTIFILVGLLPCGQNAVHYLESRYTKPATMPKHIDGILVLGGAVEKRCLRTQPHAGIQ